MVVTASSDNHSDGFAYQELGRDSRLLRSSVTGWGRRVTAGGLGNFSVSVFNLLLSVILTGLRLCQ